MKAAITVARRASSVPWILYVAIGACGIAVYYAAPVSHDVLAAIDGIFPAAVVVAIIAGIRMHRPDRLRPWFLFAAGMVFFSLPSVLRSIDVIARDMPLNQRVPGQDVMQTIGYVLIITALISLIYSREGGARDRSSLIDASIIVVGAAMLVWVFVLAPFAHDDTVPLTDRLFRMLYPVANLILLAVSVRLAVTRGARTPAFLMLLIAMVASLVGNTLSLDAIETHGIVPSGDPIGIAFFVANLFAGAAPLHPSMRTLSDVGEHESRLTSTRIALFVGASVTGIVAYTIERARGNEVDTPVILAGSLAIFLLVVVRLTGLSTAMRRSEERFRSLVQNASDAFAILEADGTFRYASPASERVVGFMPDEIAGTSCFELIHPDYADKARAFVDEVLANPGRLFEALLRARHKNGSWQWVQVSCTNRLDDPAVGGIVANFHNVTETREAEEALRDSERNSRLLFESSPLPMWVFDTETLDFLIVNDAAMTQYGYSRDEFLRMRITDIRPPEEVDRLLDEIARIRSNKNEVQKNGHWVHRRKDGSSVDVDIVSHSVEFEGRDAFLVVAQDITERTRVEGERDNLERQLRQSQKLEAVGQLAGGVAHDFNNLLAVVLNYARFVKEDLPAESDTRDDVDQIINAGDKAARLVKQLLAFSRREIVTPEVIDINEIVGDMHKMLMRTIKESINLVVDLRSDLWRTEVDRGQLEQVLLNLAVNADAAMPDGGTLQIKTSNKTISEEAAAQKAELVAGEYVCMSVSDDGIGMSEKTTAHIFEPFFTTKGTGEGTGLGLSTVYGIVKQSGGYVYVYSEEGRGTTFNIYLPATEEMAAAEIDPELAPQRHSGSETILVVEDEEGVREIASRILRSAGYKVLVAPTPAAALALGNDSRAIDLLLTDVIMPGLSGRELAAKLQSARPRLKTIFMSGYTDEIIARQGVLHEGVTFLQKPFGAEDLLPLVRDVLDHEQTPVGERSTGVLIVDDEQPMREVLRMLLESSKYHILGEASSGEEAIRLAGALHPDVIILDHFMPGMSGSQAAPRLRDASPNAKICAFSAVLSEPPLWADAFLSKERIGELPPMIDSLAV